MNKIFKNILLLSCVAAVFTSCDNFVFGNVHVDYNENPLESKGLARSGADRYVDSLSKIKVSEQVNNPDPDGAFNGWATCLAMFKEGHSHGDGMMHGNFVYHNALGSKRSLSLSATIQQNGLRLRCNARVR